MGRCRILVVEDDPVVSLHLEELVMQLVEADVVISQSAADARAALDHPLDFAFLDVDVLNGTTYALATALAERSIPFAFLSASDRDRMPTELRSAPFVPKPYTRSDILDLLRAAGKC